MESIFQSLDALQRWSLARLLAEGLPVSPRGSPTMELCGVQLILVNPRRRIITSRIRKWSFPLALGEFCWHLAGSNELPFINYYSRRWNDFADDERTIRGSCYGYRI